LARRLWVWERNEPHGSGTGRSTRRADRPQRTPASLPRHIRGIGAQGVAESGAQFTGTLYRSNVTTTWMWVHRQDLVREQVGLRWDYGVALWWGVAGSRP